MTKRDVLSIALKIVGVVSLIYGLVSIPNLLIIAGAPSENFPPQLFVAYIQAAAIALYAAVGSWLIMSSDSLSRKMIRDDSIVGFPESLDSKALLRLSLKVTGVVFSVQGLGLLARAIGEMAFENTHYGFAAMLWSRILESVLYLALGGYLLFGSAKIASFISKRPFDIKGDVND